MERNSVLPFKIDAQKCIEIAKKRRDDGDLIGALSMLYKGYESDRKNTRIRLAIAKVYSATDNYEEANKFLFELLFDLPDEEKTPVYEELAMNFFCLNNVWATRYYFHKRITANFDLGEVDIDEELLEFIKDQPNERSKYYIAYPFDKADYSSVIKRARNAYASDNVYKANKLFKSVPIECMEDDVISDYALVAFMCDEEDEAFEICKTAINARGESLAICSTLSILYRMRVNMDKCKYYYERAKALRRGEDGEEERLLSSAIEAKDYALAKECFDVVIKDREYLPTMNLLYGQCLLNVGEYQKVRHDERVVEAAVRRE